MQAAHPAPVQLMPPAGPAPYAPPRQDAGRVILIVFVVVFFVIFFGIAAFMIYGLTGFGFSDGFAPFTVLCGVLGFLVVFAIVAAIAFAANQRRAGLPPPPPIQQPMVPAGAQPPVALNCPNCGAPPSVVDRFGIATCPYCETRYVVR